MTPQQLLDRDFHVFPLQQNSKLPVPGVSWKTLTTNDPAQVELYLAMYPGCNWAVDCEKSGLNVVDVDCKNGVDGAQSWVDLCRANNHAADSFPTLVFQTPNGGYHLIYKGLGGSSVSKLGPGLDTRSKGGYIVAPGSTLPTGAYTLMVDDPITDAPPFTLTDAAADRVLAPIQGEPMTDEQHDELEEALSHIESEEYGVWYQIGMSIHSEYPGPDGLALFDEWSAQCPGKYQEGLCEQKWGSFSHGDDPEADITLATLYHHAYEGGYAGTPAADIDWGDIPEGDTYAEQESVVSDKVYEGLQEILVSVWDEVVAEDDPLDEIIPGMFETGDKVCIIGASKAKKTFFALNMAMSISAGKPFLGHVLEKPRKVLYVQMEVQKKHFKRRIKMVAPGMGIDRDKSARFDVLNLRGKQWTWAAIHRIIVEGGYEMVIFDPVYKLHNGQENAVEDMALLLAEFDRVSNLGTAVAYIHHDAKGFGGDRQMTDRGSGSGVLARDYDTGILLTRHYEDEQATVVDFVTRNYKEPDSLAVTWTGGLMQEAPGLEAIAMTASSEKARKEKESKSARTSAEEIGKETIIDAIINDFFSDGEPHGMTEVARVVHQHEDWRKMSSTDVKGVTKYLTNLVGGLPHILNNGRIADFFEDANMLSGQARFGVIVRDS